VLCAGLVIGRIFRTPTHGYEAPKAAAVCLIASAARILK